MTILSPDQLLAIALGEAPEGQSRCMNPGTSISAQLHRMRAEPLCPTCDASMRALWELNLELERFGHGLTRRAFVLKLRREGARLARERAAATYVTHQEFVRDLRQNMRIELAAA
jgi:hypothetical protein